MVLIRLCHLLWQQGFIIQTVKIYITTYFPELDEEPDSKFTKKELEKVKEDYRQDQKQQYAGRMVEQFDRLAKYSLDKDNRKMYVARKEQWENEVLKQKNRGKRL